MDLGAVSGSVPCTRALWQWPGGKTSPSTTPDTVVQDGLGLGAQGWSSPYRLSYFSNNITDERKNSPPLPEIMQSRFP